MKLKKKSKPALWKSLPMYHTKKAVDAPRRVRSISKTRDGAMKAYLVLREAWIKENQLCMACMAMGYKPKRAMDVHHSRGRVGSLLCDTRFWIPVCRDHHLWIDQNRVVARFYGLLCNSGYNSMRQPNAYMDAYRIYLAGKKIAALHPNEKEPDHNAFDLSDWEAERLRASVEKEFNEH